MNIRPSQTDWEATDRALQTLPLIVRAYVLTECPLNIKAMDVVALHKACGGKPGRTLRLLRQHVALDTERVYGESYMRLTQ